MARKRRALATTKAAKKASAAATAMSSSPFPYPSPVASASASASATSTTSTTAAPVTPVAGRRRISVSRLSTTPRSGVAASTRSQRVVNATAQATPTQPAAAAAPVLSPPLKKRVSLRREPRAVKFSLRDEETEDESAAAADQPDAKHDVCCACAEEKLAPPQIKPDPYLPEAYQRHATVLRHGGAVCDAVLTRARVHHNHSDFIVLQALEMASQFYVWTRTGRVGCSGKSSTQGPFASADKAALEFALLFASHTNCEWEARHALRFQEGCYTWIELDYSTGTPYSDSLTAAWSDNQGEMDNADSFRDFDLVPMVPSLPLPTSSSASRKRRRAAMWTTAAPPTPTPAVSASARRALASQFDWLYATGSDSDTVSGANTEPAACACAAAAMATPPASRLPEKLQEFVTLIADHTELSYAYTVTDDLLGDAVMKLPLGRLSKTTMKRGYETLEEIYEALRSRQASRARLSHLSSHFYSLIPHHSRLEVLDTMVKLGKKVRLLAELGASVRGMAHEPVAQRCAARNYLDECYALLDCELTPVAKGEHEYALIETYVRNSNCCGRKQDRLELSAIFRVEKHAQERRFEPFRQFANRQILWHGSHLANWLGILSDGLRIAPPEVASNGRTFGKGLYFTDKVTKAQAYCHCRPTNGANHCVFALSEVALGESKQLHNSDDNARQFVSHAAGGRAKAPLFHSCKGVGSCRPDTAGELVDAHGAVWPVGEPVQPDERTGLHHSEYIIYNPNQTRMRYIVLAKSPY